MAPHRIRPPMGSAVAGIGQSIIRMASFTGKELRELLRRPGVVLSLILGPFLVMFLFGLGYSGYRAPVRDRDRRPGGRGLLPRRRSTTRSWRQDAWTCGT